VSDEDIRGLVSSLSNFNNKGWLCLKIML
jgi:hypothetical protein